jgi:transcriptional regulator, tetR family
VVVDAVKSWSFLGYTEIMTRQTNTDGLRETILRISRDLLNEGGPSSLSMREVARRAGCTHQAPYHYFQGREAILVALVEEGYRDLERALREARETSEGRAPQDATRAAGHAYLACALANPGVFRIMFRSDMYDAGAHPGLHAASLAARSQLRSLATLAYGTDDPRAEVTLWAYIHGLATLVLDGPPALGAGEEAQRFAHDVIEAPYFIDGV